MSVPSIGSADITIGADASGFESEMKKSTEEVKKATEEANRDTSKSSEKAHEEMQKHSDQTADRNKKNSREAAKSWSEQFSSAATSVGQSMTSVGSTLTNKITKPVLGAVAAAGTLTTALGFKRLRGIENATQSLKGLGLTAEEASAVIDGPVMDAVTGTAFGIADAAQAASGAWAAGMKDADDLTRHLKLAGDMAAFSNSDLNAMADILTRVSAAGKVSGGDLTQMGDNGVFAAAALADSLGIAQEEVMKLASQGKISADQLKDALENQIGGSALAMGETLDGAVSNTFAAIGRLGANIWGEVYPEITDLVNEIRGVISSDEVQEWGKELGSNIAKYFKEAVGYVKQLIEWWKNLSPEGKKLIGIFSAVAVGIGPVLMGFGKILTVTGTVTKAFGTLKGAKGLGGLTKMLGGVGGAGGGFLKLLGPVGLVIGIFTTLFTTSEEFREAVFKILGVLGQLVTMIGEALAPVLTTLMEALGPIIQRIGEVLGTLISFAADLIVMLMPFIELIISLLIPAIEKVLEVVTTVFNAIIPIVEFAIGFVMGIIEAFMSMLTMDWGEFWSFLGDKVSEGWNAIKQWVSDGIEAIKQWWSDFTSTLSEAWSALWNGIKSVASTAWNGLKAGISAYLNFVKGLWSRVWEGVKATFTRIWEAIKSAADRFMGGVKQAFENTVNFVRNIPSNILNIFKNIGNLLLNSGKSLISGFTKGITAQFSKARDAVANGLGKIRNLFPFSPAKEGPFSGRGWVLYAGESLGSTFTSAAAASIERGNSQVANALSATSKTVEAGALDAANAASAGMAGIRSKLGDVSALAPGSGDYNVSTTSGGGVSTSVTRSTETILGKVQSEALYPLERVLTSILQVLQGFASGTSPSAAVVAGDGAGFLRRALPVPASVSVGSPGAVSSTTFGGDSTVYGGPLLVVQNMTVDSEERVREIAQQLQALMRRDRGAL